MFTLHSKPRLLVIALVAVFASLDAVAHTAFLLLEIDDAGSLRIETGFSDGSTGEGLMLEVKAIKTGETLSTHVIPANGVVTTALPAVPYEVVLDAGEGHRVSKDGPLPLTATASLTVVDVAGGDRDRWKQQQAQAIAAADVVLAQEYLAKRVSSDWGEQTLVLVDDQVALAGNTKSARELRDQVNARIQQALDAEQSIVVLTHGVPRACADWSWLFESFDVTLTITQGAE